MYIHRIYILTAFISFVFFRTHAHTYTNTTNKQQRRVIGVFLSFHFFVADLKLRRLNLYPLKLIIRLMNISDDVSLFLITIFTSLRASFARSSASLVPCLYRYLFGIMVALFFAHEYTWSNRIQAHAHKHSNN